MQCVWILGPSLKHTGDGYHLEFVHAIEDDANHDGQEADASYDRADDDATSLQEDKDT